MRAVYERKERVPDAKVVENLLNLKEEITKRTATDSDPRLMEMFFKINSCLFSEYPHSFQKKED